MIFYNYRRLTVAIALNFDETCMVATVCNDFSFDYVFFCVCAVMLVADCKFFL